MISPARWLVSAAVPDSLDTSTLGKAGTYRELVTALEP